MIRLSTDFEPTILDPALLEGPVLEFPLTVKEETPNPFTLYFAKAKNAADRSLEKVRSKLNLNKNRKKKFGFGILLNIICLALVITHGIQPAKEIITPMLDSKNLKPLTETKKGYEVFGFAPHWTFNKLDNVDFSTLTTFAYFGVEVDGNGNLDKDSVGYETFMSDRASKIFKKAHKAGTRVVLTITQMKNGPILALMDDPAAQENLISSVVSEVKNRGIDGVNVDLEYTGNPGQDYRNKFSIFVKNLTDRMHSEIPNSQVSVSVYASAIKEPKIYDIPELGKSTDKIFMMAYDFAVAGSDNAIPTAPLNGHQNGKYWYDIATAVKDFSKNMDPQKLILGVPYYGYNYLVYEPEVKAETRPSYSWRGSPRAQTYTTANENIKPDMEGIDDYKEGWDEDGQVGYRAYHVTETDTWRIIFLGDPKSLSLKYDFAKNQNLAGVGIWALGFDEGKPELWALLKDKFGTNSLAEKR